MEIVFSLSQIQKLAATVWQQYKHHKIWVFEGNMGAGKTTFIQALCQAAGVKDHISSPTYSIINTYTDHKNNNFYHMDWYRLKDEQEAIDAGVEEALYSGSHCFVEWPSKAAYLLPEKILALRLSAISDQKHLLVINQE